VLASASPRRQALLRAAGLDFRVAPADVDETPPPGLAPGEVARRLALAKALAGAEREAGDGLVLGADTIVVAPDGRLLGKARDEAEARAMLLDTLASRWHRVVTGVALIAARSGWAASAAVESEVRMHGADRLEPYVASGLWRGKAGAYGVQDEPSPVAALRGSRSNVVGLPVEAVVALLAEAAAAATATAAPGREGRP